MKQEVKGLWTTALRSGEYKQGKSQLRIERSEETQHCCLGVLTDLAVKAGVCNWNVDVHGADPHLPSMVREWAGLNDSNPYVPFIDSDGFEDDENLANLNDGSHSFTEIADLIERYL